MRWPGMCLCAAAAPVAGYCEERFQERDGGSLESVSVQVNGG